MRWQVSRGSGGEISKFMLLLHSALAIGAVPHCSIRPSPPLKIGLLRLRGGTPQALLDHSAAAAGLFNNMKTPATLLFGALVPLGFLAPLPNSADGKPYAAMRRLHTLLAVFSLSNELISVIYATAASNRLIEASIAPTASVFCLLERDFELPWLATNVHFLLGVAGAMTMVGMRVFLSCAGSPLAVAAVGISTSALVLMTEVINAEVARSGRGSFAHLIFRYVYLLFSRPQSLLHRLSTTTWSLSLLVGAWMAVAASRDVPASRN
mgnify:CR=1 FL=1